MQDNRIKLLHVKPYAKLSKEINLSSFLELIIMKVNSIIVNYLKTLYMMTFTILSELPRKIIISPTTAPPHTQIID